MTDKELMLAAIKEAEEGILAGDGGPFGAVVSFEGEIIGKAHNSVLKDKDSTHHAEMQAISRASSSLDKFDLSRCTIYTTTEPCPMCFSAIHWARIDKIVYGSGIQDVMALGFNELAIPALKLKKMSDLTVQIESGFMLDECKDLLSKWSSLPNRQTY
ncbi:MAG: nucleoside deaminase [Candidatus Aadella gelida]|nr:nucleoside deaminase [Candidatus Aadella gelida]